MSTRTTLVLINSNKKDKHNIQIHLYKEMHDSLTYLEIDCDTCYSGIKVCLHEHLAKQLEGLLKLLT